MKILTMQDLQNHHATTPSGIWIVDNLLRTNRKRISLLCGSPHAGKSTLARQLTVAVCHGEPFLGRPTLKGKVAYWQTEESEDDAREDFLKSGMTLDEPNFVLLHADPAENNLKALNKCLNDNPDIRLVIIETLDDFLQMDDLGDNPSARRAFEKFDQEVVAQHSHRVCFVALHHFKKSDEQRGISLHKILGATVIAGKTDCKIFMRGCGDGDPRRIISVDIRKGIRIEPTYLAFDEASQTSVLGQTLADEKAESKKAVVSVNASELRSRCVSVVAGDPGITKTDAYTKVGGYKKAAEEMFDVLIREGAIIPKRGGKTGTAHLLYVKGAVPSAASTPQDTSWEPPQPAKEPQSFEEQLRQAKDDLALAMKADSRFSWARKGIQQAQARVAEIESQMGSTTDANAEQGREGTTIQ